MIMRYMDFSIKKTAPLLGLMAVIILTAVLTFGWKYASYGETPFFRSVGLLAQETAITVFFTARHVASGGFASALLAFEGDPQKAEAASAARAIPVLTYHRITPTADDTANVPFSHFMDQMERLHRAGWRTITLGEYEAFMRGEIALPEKSFMITFDDGAQQSFYPTDPIFKILGFNAVQYIVVAGSERRRTTYYLSPPQIQQMLNTGRWEIGSHSYDAHHPYPTGPEPHQEGIFYSDKLWIAEESRLETDTEFRERVARDLMESRTALESTYGVTIDSFAFPFGGEAGIRSAQNYPEGESITIDEASRIYSLGWVQTEHKDYTYNYPGYRDFLHYRIHVDHDWDGKRLLAIMENGLPKNLPFYDDMKKNTGWQQSWGDVRAGEILQLASMPGETSASSILDGTQLWRTYETHMLAEWQSGSAFLLGNAKDARTYRACVFSEGGVQVQDTTESDSRVLARTQNARIVYGTDVQLGMRINPNSIDCLYDGRVVLSANVESRTGGIGVQVWNPELGEALLIIKEVSVELL